MMNNDGIMTAGGLDGAWMATLAQGGEVAMPGNPAQTGNATQGAPTGAPGGPPQQTPGLFGGPFLMILLLFFVVMIFSQIMAGRRERRRRTEMLSSIARHDRVQTIGGIIGTVQELRDDEVVLKVDENSNTRIRFARSAIQQVLKSSGNAPEAASGGENGAGKTV